MKIITHKYLDLVEVYAVLAMCEAIERWIDPALDSGSVYAEDFFVCEADKAW